MAVRRERERRAVLEEAVAQMRRRGRPQCEMADLFMDFKGINITLAVMARAVISGRIDCKTAGRLVVQLQMLSKLLWQIHRRKTSTTEARRHGELWKSYPGPSFAVKAPFIQDESLERAEFAPRSFITPQIYADQRRSGRTQKSLNLTTEAQRHGEEPRTADHFPPNYPATNHFVARGQDANHWAANEHEKMQIVLVAKVRALAERRGWGHAPPELLRAA